MGFIMSYYVSRLNTAMRTPELHAWRSSHDIPPLTRSPGRTSMKTEPSRRMILLRYDSLSLFLNYF